MDNLEKVEKLREKTGVSYEEAKAALEATNYDVLDAIIYLEKNGKVKAPEVTSYTTEQAQQTSTEFEQAQQEYTRDCNKKTFGQMMDQFFFLVWKTFKEKRGFQVHHRKTRQHYGECTCSGIDTCDRLRILDYDSIISGRFIL